MANKNIGDLVFFDEHEPHYEEDLTPAEKCVQGQPLQRTWNHFTYDDERLYVGVWEAEPGCWNISYTENEYCRILSGLSIIRDADGKEHRLEPGDDFVIPSGFTGQWEVIETTRKVYVIHLPE